MRTLKRAGKTGLLAIAAALIAMAPAAAAYAKLNVVTTLPDLAAIAKAVGGADVGVTALAPHDADPHYVDARPNLMLPLSRADLVIANGLQLEQGWLPPLIRGSRNPKILIGSRGYLDASFFVQRLQVPTNRATRAAGDVHPGGNPHFTHDPRAAARIGRAIADRLALLEPAKAAAYKGRAKAFEAEMGKLATTWRARFAKLPAARRKVVSYHRSLAYLFDWLQLSEVITVEPRPGIPPNPGHTARVLSTMRAAGAKVIVQESFYPRTTSKTLARLAKGSLVVIPGGANFAAGQTFAARVGKTAAALHAALQR